MDQLTLWPQTLNEETWPGLFLFLLPMVTEPIEYITQLQLDLKTL